MKSPAIFFDRRIDMEAVEAMADYGDYVYLQFGVFSDPPHLFLRGQRAEAFRQWFRNTHGYDDETRQQCVRISDVHLQELTARLESGQSLTTSESLKLIAALRTMTLDRDSLIQMESRTNDSFFTELNRSEDGTIRRPVECLMADDCRVSSDGSCDHTQDDASVCWFWDGPEQWQRDQDA